MDKDYIKFVRGVYSYCDNHIGEEVLFPLFINCWPEEIIIKKKDLVIYTSKIVSKLISEDVLKEVPKGFDNVYGLYKILEHERFTL